MSERIELVLNMHRGHLDHRLAEERMVRDLALRLLPRQCATRTTDRRPGSIPIPIPIPVPIANNRLERRRIHIRLECARFDIQLERRGRRARRTRGRRLPLPVRIPVRGLQQTASGNRSRSTSTGRRLGGARRARKRCRRLGSLPAERRDFLDEYGRLGGRSGRGRHRRCRHSMGVGMGLSMSLLHSKFRRRRVRSSYWTRTRSRSPCTSTGSRGGIDDGRGGCFEVERSGDFGAGRADGCGCGDLCTDCTRVGGFCFAGGFFDKLFLLRGVLGEDGDEVGGDGTVELESVGRRIAFSCGTPNLRWFGKTRVCTNTVRNHQYESFKINISLE